MIRQTHNPDPGELKPSRPRPYQGYFDLAISQIAAQPALNAFDPEGANCFSATVAALMGQPTYSMFFDPPGGPADARSLWESTLMRVARDITDAPREHAMRAIDRIWPGVSIDHPGADMAGQLARLGVSLPGGLGALEHGTLIHICLLGLAWRGFWDGPLPVEDIGLAAWAATVRAALIGS